MRRSANQPGVGRGNSARRGFTLLELSLVSVLGAIFVLAALGFFVAVDRGERRLGKRLDQTVEVGRLHLVLRRTFDSIVISEEQTPASVSGSRQPAGVPRAPEDPNRTYPAPRFILEEDPALGRMTSRARALAGGSGREVRAPQRLEVVLAASPVSEPREGWEKFDLARRAREASSGRERGSSSPAGPREEGAEEEESASVAVRGAIELRPKLDRNGMPVDPERTVWELWWTRLAPRERLAEIGQARGPAVAVGEPVLLATDLANFNVRVFHGREWHTEHTTTWFQQLPAYFQVEVETTGGIWARWLFEVGWVQGPEIAESEAARGGAAEGERAPDGEGAGRSGTSTGRGGTVTPGGAK